MKSEPPSAGRWAFFKILSLFAFCALTQAWAGPVSALRVGPIEASKITVSMILSAQAIKKCSGTYRGQISLFEAAPGINVSGNLKNNAGVCELTADLPWSGVSERILQLARADLLQVRFKGDVAEAKPVTKVDWMLAAPRAAVLLTEPMKETVQRFAKATDLHTGAMGLKSSTVNADITLQSPLAFDMPILLASCELEIHGKTVATGLKDAFVLNAKRSTLLRIPVTINHQALLSASGNILTNMGQIEGRLVGLVRMKFHGANVDFPMEFPIKLRLL